MCYGTKHTHTRTHTSHIQQKEKRYSMAHFVPHSTKHSVSRPVSVYLITERCVVWLQSLTSAPYQPTAVTTSVTTRWAATSASVALATSSIQMENGVKVRTVHFGLQGTGSLGLWVAPLCGGGFSSSVSKCYRNRPAWTHLP